MTQCLTRSVPTGETLTVLSSHTCPCTAGLFPPPLGRHLLTSSLDSSLILWEISSSTHLFKTSIFCPPNSPEFDPAIHGITALAVSPNGQLAAVGGANGLVKLVSLPKGDVVATLHGHAQGESVEALVYVDLLAGAGGGKGVVLVSGGTDGKGFVWDSATGRVRAELSHDVRSIDLTVWTEITYVGPYHIPRTPPCPSSSSRHHRLRRLHPQNMGRPHWCPDRHTYRSHRCRQWRCGRACPARDGSRARKGRTSRGQCRGRRGEPHLADMNMHIPNASDIDFAVRSMPE